MKAPAAAFFDLDRTLLSGGSGLVFSEAMRAAGLVTATIPGERIVYGCSAGGREPARA